MDAQRHNEIVRAQFGLQARPFSSALHANDPGLLDQFLRLIALQPGERVIDVCSGPGIVASRLSAAGKVVCLDVTHEMLLEARTRAPHALLVESHAGRMPLGRGRTARPLFDISLTRLSLHHVQDALEVVSEMARAASPAGRIVINDIVTSEHEDESDYTERIERLRDPSHARCMTPTELETLPVKCGLEVTAVESYVSTIDHDEWMTRVFPPEENRSVVRNMLEDIAGRDMGGMRVEKIGGRLWISRRGMIVCARHPAC